MCPKRRHDAAATVCTARVGGRCIVIYNPTPPSSSSSCRVYTHLRLAAFNHERESESLLLWFANAVTIIHYNTLARRCYNYYGRRSEWFAQMAGESPRRRVFVESDRWFESEMDFKTLLRGFFSIIRYASRVEYSDVMQNALRLSDRLFNEFANYRVSRYVNIDLFSYTYTLWSEGLLEKCSTLVCL